MAAGAQPPDGVRLRAGFGVAWRRGPHCVHDPTPHVSQLRLDPLTGRWVVVSVDRAARPQAFATRSLPVQADYDRPCPFCPGNEEATPPELERYGEQGEWLVRVVPNHVCAAVNLADSLTVVAAGVPVDTWAVAARGRN